MSGSSRKACVASAIIFSMLLSGMQGFAYASSGYSSIVGSAIQQEPATSVTVPTGGTAYLYAATIGGSFTISPQDFLLDLGVTNAETYQSVIIGHSSSNVGTFNRNGALYPSIGGIGVTGNFYQQIPFQNSGLNSVSGSFSLSTDSLVVLVSAASNTLTPPPSLSGPFSIDRASSNPQGGQIILAHASLTAGGPYSFNLQYTPWDDPMARVIGVVLYLFQSASPPPPSPPSFQLEVSPQAQTLALGGSITYQARIVPLNGFLSPVVISLSNIPQGVSESCSVTLCTVSPLGYTANLILDASDQAQTGTFSLPLRATSIGLPSVTVSKTLTLVITKLIGVKSVISFSNFHISSSTFPCSGAVLGPPAADDEQCFSIQQNFFVNTPGGSQTYWVQNVLFVAKFSGLTKVAPIVNIWDWSAQGHPLIGCNGTVIGPRQCNYNRGYQLASQPYVLASSVDGATFRFDSLGQVLDYELDRPLPVGSYVSQLLNPVHAPQLDIVGIGNGAQASFDSLNDGNVLSYVLLASQAGWTDAVVQTILPCGFFCGDPNSCPIPCSSGTATAETSLNLQWTIPAPTITQTLPHASFGYDAGVNDEGVAFVPGTMLTQSSTTTLIQSGTASFQQIETTGVNATINSSSAPDGTPVTFTSTVLQEGQPSGTGLLAIGPLEFLDGQVVGISDGVARVCLTNPLLLTGSLLSEFTVMQYWSGSAWVNATNITVSVLTFTICGDIPVSVLTGTPIVIGNPPHISVSTFFTDGNDALLPVDSNGNTEVDVVLANGKVRSTNPGQVLAWINLTNTGNMPLQSVRLDGTLPADWTLHPPWMPSQSAIRVFFVLTNGTRLDKTNQTSVITTTGNPQTISLSIANITATAAGTSLAPGESILVSVKLSYALKGTSQTPQSYPRDCTDTASTAAWTQTFYAGGQASAGSSALFRAYAKVLGDVNGDFQVDILDAALVAYSYGSRSGDARWNIMTDTDSNGLIDILDVAQVAYYYGTHA